MLSETDISDFNAALLGGGLALLPTETVYGLGVNARNQKAVDRLYAVKGRDFNKPIAICIKHSQAAAVLVQWSKTAQQLADQFWPGPLSLVLPVKNGLDLDPRLMGHFADGTPSLSLRCPQTLWLEHLVIDYLALTSANKSSHPDITTFKTAFDIFSSDVDAAVKGQPSVHGIPSTIIAVKDDICTILRDGALPFEAFAPLNLTWSPLA